VVLGGVGAFMAARVARSFPLMDVEPNSLQDDSLERIRGFMVKRDLSGLLQIYGVAGFYISIWTLGLFKVIFGIREFWVQNSLLFKLVAISSLLFLLVALVVSFFLLVRYHKNWLRLERARRIPEAFPLYEPQPSYALALQFGVPPALKKTLARRDIIQIIQVLSVLLLLWIIIFTIVAFANNTHMTMQIVLIPWLGAAGLGIFLVPIVWYIALSEYERIEASEYGLMRQKGLLQRFLPWETVCLFAVGGKANRQPEWVELSSANVLLRWPFTLKDFGILGGPRYTFLARDTPESPYRSITRGEYEYRLQRLYGYLYLMTSLPLRDLRDVRLWA
jgi:hypothetical protein